MSYIVKHREEVITYVGSSFDSKREAEAYIRVNSTSLDDQGIRTGSFQHPVQIGMTREWVIVRVDRDARIAELEALAAERAVSDAQKARADKAEADVTRLHGLIKESSDHNERANAAEKYRTDVQATLSCAASVIEMLLEWHKDGGPREDDATYKGALAGVRAVQRAIAEACK